MNKQTIMGFPAIIQAGFNLAASAIGALINDSLKSNENEREQSNLDRELRRQAAVEIEKSKLRREEAAHNADLEIRKHSEALRREQWAKDKELTRKKEAAEAEIRSRERLTELEIRLQTEIKRIDAETEQWKKDKEYERAKKVAEAIVHFRQCLTELQLNTIRTIGNMDIDLRAKAHDLILSKTKAYKELQDQAYKDAESELERIEAKFSGNKRIQDIMFGSVESKLSSIIEGTSQFIQGLNEDIQKMNQNIGLITQTGQAFIDRQIESQFSSLTLTSQSAKAVGYYDAEEIK